MRRPYIHVILGFLLLNQIGICGEKRPGEIRFAWLSDTHIGAPGADYDLRQVVGDINSLEDLDFAVITGDITEVDIGGNLGLAKRILDSLDVPYYIIPGNHDTRWSSSGGTRFVSLWGDDKFIFRQGDFYFIGLHQGPLMRMGDGSFARQDLLWLESVLDTLADRSANLCFITHYPIDESVSNSVEFLSIIREHNPRLILHGHGHANRATMFGGIPGLMGRSTLRRNSSAGGYNVVRILTDSVIVSEYQPDSPTKPAWYREPLVRPDLPPASFVTFPDPSGPANYSRTGERWRHQTDYTIASGPAVSGDRVVIANTGGEVWALSLSDGRYLWGYRAAGPIFSTPEITNNRVCFGATDSSITCLNLQSGELLWKYQASGPIVSSPAVYKDKVYIGSSDGYFRCLDMKTGTLIWESSDIPGYVECKPLVHKRSIYFGAWDETLYSLNLKNGTIRWQWKGGSPGQLYSPAACNPVGAADKVFIVAPDRAMTAIDAKTGTTSWRSRRYSVRESIGVSEDAQTLYVKCMWDTVVSFAVEEAIPSIKWESPLGFGFDISPVPPVEKDGTVFVSTQQGYVYALDALAGSIKWDFRVSRGMVSGVVPLSESEILVTAVDGSVSYISMGKP
ncbi:PQQ-binding-like beta-propeller repeat protein [Candidatus Neomarinimicrobiota bacterium]